MAEMVRCWVLRHPDGDPWEPRDDERDAHYTETDARRAIDDLLREQVEEGTQGAADLRPVQLPAPCLILTCSACGEEPDDDEFAHVHFPDVTALDRYADMSDWRRVDGLWRCCNCPTEDDEDEEPKATRPGPLDVPLPIEMRTE